MVKNMTKRLFGIVLMMMLMTTLSLKVYAGPVTVKSGITNGTVAVDKATANPGETVTITVTPANGFYAEKSDVKAEKTIDGGSAQVPGLKANGPGVGSFVDIQGDAPADISGVATYTFTMPEAPYGVQVSAEFHECTPITQAMFNSVAEQEFTGQQITPAVQCADGYNLVLGTDFTVEYGENVGPGMNAGTVTITGKNKYSGTALLYFTIFRETYEIRWGQGNPWDSQHVIVMTKGADGKWVAANQEMAATSEFKVVKKREAGETTDTWYGAPGNDNYWINAGTLNTEIQLYEGNQNLYFPNSGTYTFTFDPSKNILVVTGDMLYNVTVADGIQNGTVVANPTSGKAGDQITITATPAEGYKLNSLSINGEPAAADENEDGTYTYVLTMPAADVTITAEFSKKLYNITKAETENGSFTVSKNSGYMGDVIKVQPEPNEGYTVDQITVTAADGTTVPVNDLNEFTMPASNVTVAVTFRALTISYEIRWGQGTPWAQENVIPMLLGDDGKWVAASQSMAATSEFKVVKKVQDGDNEPTLTWLGAQADGMYWITADNLGTNISLYENTPNLYFPKTGVYTFTFDPSNNTLVVTGNMLYNVTVADGIQNGTVVANPTSGKAGDQITITATPAEGYKLNSLSINGEPAAADENEDGTYTYVLTMPAADVTITAEFSKKLYNITKAETENGSFTVSKNSGYMGDVIKVQPEPNEGYTVDQITVTAADGTTVPVNDLNEFTMPASNVTVAVTFRALTISYEIRWGQGTPWAQENVIPMLLGDDGKWVAASQSMAATSEFKVVKKVQDGDNEPTLTWLGAQADGMYWITADNLGTNISLYENTPNLYFPKTGVYTFTFDPSNNTLVVTGDMLYNITVAETTNGTATTNPDGPVAAGTEVTIVPAPAEGYEVDSITVTYGENQTVVVTDNKFVMPAADVTVNVSFKAIQYVLEGVTFTANRHWATYYNGTRNLALPESIQAYVVNSVVNDAVDITEIDHIPAGVGVLLYCEAAAEQVFTTPYTGSTGTYTSKLVGSDEAQTITEGYVLYNDTFIRSEEGTVAAHRCYLPTSQVAGAPRILKIGASDVPTAIESIIAQGNVAGINYVNLSGMTSSEPWRGVNIAVITFTDGTTRTVKVIK